MANVNNVITKTVASLVKNLSVRNRDVISRRFGLKSGKKETLESIGKGYGITRERVRQIEEFSMNQLSKAIPSVPEVAKYVSLAKDILSGSGGIMRESDLFKAFSGNDNPNVINSSLVFVLTLAGEPVRFGESDTHHSFWAATRGHQESFKKNISALIGAFQKNEKPVAEAGIASFADKSGIGSLKDIKVFLSVSKELGRNVFGEVGLVNWAEVKPKGVRDKAYLVLKKENKPKHFSEIAKLINTTAFSARKANTQTVHNELIKDSRFVLILNSFKTVFSLLLSFWWVYLPILLFYIAYFSLLNYTSLKYRLSLEWVLLEVLIPKEVRKSPKAMEQVFAGLHGVYAIPVRWHQTVFKGKVPDWFSFEMVGRAGETHFYIRTFSKYRNLVESQIYAQYPTAEVIEAVDYINDTPP